MKITAVIPARSGSEGIKDKNIMKVQGKPLIAYSIEAALKSSFVTNVVVNTDSEEYAKLSQAYGAEVPYLRPAELANGEVHAVYVVLHYLSWLKENGLEQPDVVVMLLPTSPLRKAGHIDEAIQTYLENKRGSVISVTEAAKPPHYIRKVIDGKLVPFVENHHANFQRQELEALYELNGSIYVKSSKDLLLDQTFHGQEVYPYVMERRCSVDVNEPLDLEWAEFLIQKEKTNE